MHRLFFKISCILSLALLLGACRSAGTATTGNRLNKISKEALINNLVSAQTQFSTFETRIKVRYEDSKRLQNLTVTLRMQKDSLIWMNASFLGISMARARITPEKVQYYEKLDKTYFEGDFNILSRWLGTELNFYQLQNLLLAEPLITLADTPFETRPDKKFYRVDTRDATENILVMLLLRPDNFKTASQQIIRRDQGQMVIAQYDAFQEVSGVIFPETLQITATDPQEKISINLQYDRPEINHRLNLPFNIPSGYTQLATSE